MGGKFGVTNLCVVASVLAGLANSGGRIMADNKVDEKDVMELPQMVLLIPLLMKADWSQLVPEATELDAEDGEILLAHFKKEFDIPQDNVEFLVEDVLSFLRDGANLVRRAIAIRQTKKMVA